ncbi:MAG: hypothetical protein QW222_02440 [Candidatus Bathyarchaeia archaeon]
MQLLYIESHPYVVFLPEGRKERTLSAIFGSKASIDILRFCLKQGISNKIYQKELLEKLSYSNKTIIENLKVLSRLGVLLEDMEKIEREGRIIWVKAYQLTDLGKWFALLLAEEKELPESEKRDILQNIFRIYIRWVRNLSEKLNMNRESFKKIFEEEMKVEN